jgi:hypothetical protein
MNLTVDGNTFDGNGVFETCATMGCNSYGIVTQGTQAATIRYTIQNNDIVNHLDAGIAARSDNNSNVQGLIKNNTIGRATSPRTGSYRDRGIFLARTGVTRARPIDMLSVIEQVETFPAIHHRTSSAIHRFVFS